ncbi:LysR family transcriptional regulator [Aliamphritea spongicola]|uniref:LysR family transcriptional regulator n=1 Tax=Aliamphritea spongicola TaxID=707589 RepID=UPI00196A2E48|nr:LysR family transcriptional regulator [Aliamphritea spongicola]MBN3560784.1 LysR family transcriptional regulator [Aliamphritea spongicola]
MDRLRDMQLFVKAVEKGSFSQAAKVVGLTPAMVGRRIAALETELGFMLFNRTTRRMELTPGGRNYYEGCTAILRDVSELEASVTSAHQSNPQGQIRLSAPDGLGSPFLIEAMKLFRHRYPQVSFDLDLSSEPLDLIKEQIDLSVRLAFELNDSSMVASRLGRTSFGLYASPDYIRERGRPVTLEDLKQHDCLHMGRSKYGDYWNILNDGKVVSFRLQWALTVPNTECLIQAAAEGMGVAMIPKLFAHEAVNAGKIVLLEGIAEFPALSIYAMYPTRKHLPYRVNLFLDFLKEWAPDKLMG